MLLVMRFFIHNNKMTDYCDFY